MALASSAGHTGQLCQDRFGVKPGSLVSEARLGPASTGLGTDPSMGVHKLYFARAPAQLQDVLAPDIFSQDCLTLVPPRSSAPRLLGCITLELEHRQSCTCKEEKGVAEPIPAPRSLIFSESGAVFSGANFISLLWY